MLVLQDSVWVVFKGGVEIWLCEVEEKKLCGKGLWLGVWFKLDLVLGLDVEGQECFEVLKVWCFEVVKEYGLLVYVIFQNMMLVEMVCVMFGDLVELGEISGVGVKKFEVYGCEILWVLGC